MRTNKAWVWLVLLLAGCTTRELAWLVPRASVGFAVRTHEGQTFGAGFVTLSSPLEHTGRGTRPFRAPRTGERWRLLGPPPDCAVVEACRWEGRARAGTLADLVEEETLEGGGR